MQRVQTNLSAEKASLSAEFEPVGHQSSNKFVSRVQTSVFASKVQTSLSAKFKPVCQQRVQTRFVNPLSPATQFPRKSKHQLP
jgi:hypothetical protein